jgi:uncharacterized membrane protein YkvA (DUF1232 family)
MPADRGRDLSCPIMSSDRAPLTPHGHEGSASAPESRASDPFPRELAIDLVKRVPAYARLAWGLSREPDLPRARRLALVGAVAYLVSPIDAIPGLIPVIGQVDDVLVVLLTLRFALAGLSPEVRRRHLAAAGLTEEDTAADLDAIAAMGAWLLRTGGRAGARASAVAIDVGGRWAARAGRRAGGVAGRVGSAGTKRVTNAIGSRLPARLPGRGPDRPPPDEA